MKLPQTPPKPAQLMGDVLEAFMKHPSLEHDGEYLHWDELRRRDPPEGLTHHAWWQAMRMRRRVATRATPFVDIAGRRISFATTDAVHRLVHRIDRDASGRIELPEDVTNEATRDRYIVSSLIEEAITSSQLEGAATTRAVAKEMIRSNREPRTRDERMILNNFRAMQWVRAHRAELLTPALVCELQEILTDGTLDNPGASGRFRTHDELIQVVDPSDNEILHTPPPADELAERVARMCSFANTEDPQGPFIHPVLRAILLHFVLAYDHPFVDGNGRTARALFYWSMLRQGYWLTEFLSISSVIKRARAQYARAFLFTETDENDATYFFIHQLGVLCKAVDDLTAYLKRKASEVRGLEQQLRARDDLNNRQLALVAHALRHADARYTIEGHQHSHRVVYETARTDLLGLADQGFLVQRKSGRKWTFTPAPDLEKRLGRRR